MRYINRALDNSIHTCLLLFQHWECKMLITLFHYVISANYMWILVEGLHLHTLVYVSVFSERGSMKWYYLIGWGKIMRSSNTIFIIKQINLFTLMFSYILT